jgi:glutamine---fructose-6-phosphate transaminase (isomerizing)
LNMEEQYRRIAEDILAEARDVLYMGRGSSFPIALEGALKLKELSYIHAEGYAGGEMKHGPIALISDGFPVVAIAPRDSSYERMLGNIEEVRAREGQVIAVVQPGDKLVANKAQHVIEVPAAAELLAPLVTVVPLQLLAYHIAVRRGCDVDQPRNLAKSVTVE